MGGVTPAACTPRSHDTPRVHPRESPFMLQWPLGWDPTSGIFHCMGPWEAAEALQGQQGSGATYVPHLEHPRQLLRTPSGE